MSPIKCHIHKLGDEMSLFTYTAYTATYTTLNVENQRFI